MQECLIPPCFWKLKGWLSDSVRLGCGYPPAGVSGFFLPSHTGISWCFLAYFPSSSNTSIPTLALIMSALEKAKQFSLPGNSDSLSFPVHFNMQEPWRKVACLFSFSWWSGFHLDLQENFLPPFLSLDLLNTSSQIFCGHSDYKKRKDQYFLTALFHIRYWLLLHIPSYLMVTIHLIVDCIFFTFKDEDINSRRIIARVDL